MKKITLLPVFRTLLQHPLKPLILLIFILNLGVANIQ